MSHATPHHTKPQNSRHESRMPSSFRNISRRASQFLKRDRSHDRQENISFHSKDSRKDISSDEGCVPSLPLILKHNQRSQAPAQFSITPHSPLRDLVPQLPEIKDLGKGKVVKKAKSLAVIPAIPRSAAQDLADEGIDTIKHHFSLDLKRDLFHMPGAFPKSSSPVASEPSPASLVSPIPSPLKLWLTCEKKLNQSTDTVIRVKPSSLTLSSGYSVSLVPSPVKAWLTYNKNLNGSADTVTGHRPESEQSISSLFQNISGVPHSEAEDSI